MQQRPINPWQWQEPLSFSQAVEVTGAIRVLYCAGQTSVDANGQPVYLGDMTQQIEQAFDNLETLLAKSDYTLQQVVRLNYYTTDMTAFNDAYAVVTKRLAHHPLALCWGWPAWPYQAYWLRLKRRLLNS